jgi:hypothetical protein
MSSLTAAARRRGDGSGNWVQIAWNIFWAMISEIFDESAYQRFLERTNSSRSKESYHAFLRERAASDVSKPRCC